MASSNNRINISINGKEIANEIGAIEKAYRDLSKEVKTLTIGSDSYNNKIEELSNLRTVLSDHRQSISGISKGYTLASTTLQTLAGYAGIAFGVESVVSYGREVFKAGVELTALERKAKIVFAETLPAVTKAAEANATAMGLTTAQYTKAAAEVGDLLIPMGFTRDAASQMSVQLTNLGGVLSEWSGGTRTATETTEILRKALLGERDALEGLGIQITEEQVKQALQAKGYDKLTGKAEEQAKALVTLELIMAKSTDAQAAFATGGESATRKMAEMNAKLAQIKENLGTALMPIFAGLIEGLAGMAIGFSNVVNGVAGFESSQRKAADSVMKAQLAFNNEIETLKTANLSQDAHRELVDKINYKYKEFLPTQIAYNATVSELSGLQGEVNKKFTEKIVLLSMEANLVETNRKLLDVKKQELKIQENLTRVQNAAIDKQNPYTVVTGESGRGAVLNSLKKELENNKKAQQDLQKEMENTVKAAQSMKINVDAVLGTDKNPDIIPNAALSTPDTKPADKAQKELEDKLAKIQDIIKKHQEDLQVLDSQRLKDIAANYDAQIALAENAQQREDLTKRKNYEIELQKDIEAIELKYQKDIEKEQELVKDKTQKVSDAAKRAVITLETQREQEINILRQTREQKRTDDEIKTAQERAMRVAEAEAESAKTTIDQQEKWAKEKADILKKADETLKKPIVDKALDPLETLKAAQQAELEAVQLHYKSLLDELIKLHGDKEFLTGDALIKYNALIERKKQEEVLINKKGAKDNEKIDAEAAAKKIQNYSVLFKELGSIASSLSDIFQTEGEKQNAFQKSMALAQIAMDTASGISSAIASGMKVGITPIEKAIVIASGIALVLTNIARARKVLTEAPDVKKQKYMGGFETVTGGTDGRTYQAQHITQNTTGLLDYPNPIITPSGILANEKGREYYISATDLRKPIVMNHVRAIEAIRTQRVEGGFNYPAPPQYQAPTVAPQQDNTALMSVLMKQNELLTLLLTQGVQAKVSDKTILDIEDRFQTINNLSNSFYRN